MRGYSEKRKAHVRKGISNYVAVLKVLSAKGDYTRNEMWYRHLSPSDISIANRTMANMIDKERCTECLSKLPLTLLICRHC